MLDVAFGRKKALKQFEKYDSFTKKRILKEIDEIRNNPSIGEQLTGDLVGYYKYRFSDYRIIYNYTDDRIIIVTIAQRQNVYEELTRYIHTTK